jgi:hypothetical protein
VIEELLAELLLHRLDVVDVEVSAENTYAAVNVEANTAGAYNGVGVVEVESSNISNCEALAGVHVRKGNGAANDAGEAGDIGELLDGGQEATNAARFRVLAELLQHELLKLRVHVEAPRYSHPTHKTGVHLPPRVYMRMHRSIPH